MNNESYLMNGFLSKVFWLLLKIQSILSPSIMKMDKRISASSLEQNLAIKISIDNVKKEVFFITYNLKSTKVIVCASIPTANCLLPQETRLEEVPKPQNF